MGGIDGLGWMCISYADYHSYLVVGVLYLTNTTFYSRLLLKTIPQAFVPSIGRPALTITTTTSLDASRINAKQEKRKRNRENMRKFKTGGRKGTSRKKMMRKMASSAARQVGSFVLFSFDAPICSISLLSWISSVSSSNPFVCSILYIKIENEFIAKCFMTVPPPNMDEKA